MHDRLGLPSLESLCIEYMHVYRLHCRELMILGRERELQLYKTKIAINEIKAVKLWRNHNLKDLLSE